MGVGKCGQIGGKLGKAGENAGATMLAMHICKRIAYQFVPAKPNRVIAWLMRPYVRHWLMRRALDVRRVQVSGLEEWRALHRSGDRLLITSNHPAHADGYTLAWCLHHHGLPSQFVTDYANMVTGDPIEMAVLRACGTFSINPHDFDPASFKTAMKILTGKNRHRAVLYFPEGNIFMANDRVNRFHDGSFYLATRAAQRLERQDGSHRMHVCPLAVKFTHMVDARSALENAVADLQDYLQVQRQALSTQPTDVLSALGVAAVNHTARQVGCHVVMRTVGELPTVLNQVVGELEQALGIDSAKDGVSESSEKLAMVRRVFYGQLNAGQMDAPRVEALSALLNFALRLDSYALDYVCEKPTLDRVSETVHAIYDDLHNERLRLRLPMLAMVRGGEPIAVVSPTKNDRSKQAIHDLAHESQRATQRLVDQMNAANDQPGAEMF